jgi:hypothetical protein
VAGSASSRNGTAEDSENVGAPESLEVVRHIGWRTDFLQLCFVVAVGRIEGEVVIEHSGEYILPLRSGINFTFSSR